MNIIWLKDAEDKELVGEKALSLAELYRLKLPIPEAFIISSEVYEKFLNQIKPEIDEIINNIADENSLKEAVSKINKLFLNLEFPDDFKAEISEAYKKLDSSLDSIPQNFDFIKASRDPLFIVVRSSSTHYVPDHHSTFPGIKGPTDLIQAIKHVWASLFSARAIAYRKKTGISEPKIAIIVQKMLNITRSGVIFTSDPMKADSDKVLIEAEYGFSKKANPSQFLFDKNTLSSINAKLQKQRNYYLREGSGRIIKQNVPVDIASLSPLSEDDAKSLINMSKKVENKFNAPQIIEWASENKKLFLLQSHPLKLRALISNAAPKENMILRGCPIFPAQIEGKVSVVNSKEDADNFMEDDILVTDMTNPYLFFVADKAKAIITRGGGFASHAVQLCKELDKPCVIGADISILNNGDEISLDENGFIYREKVEPVIEVEVSGDLNQIFNTVAEIEKQVTELVYQDAEKRRMGEIEDKDYSKLLSDIEWDVREIRKKLQNHLSASDNP